MTAPAPRARVVDEIATMLLDPPCMLEDFVSLHAELERRWPDRTESEFRAAVRNALLRAGCDLGDPRLSRTLH